MIRTKKDLSTTNSLFREIIYRKLERIDKTLDWIIILLMPMYNKEGNPIPPELKELKKHLKS